MYKNNNHRLWEEKPALGACSPFGKLKESGFHRLVKIWVDGGYRGKGFIHWVIDVYRWILSVVTRHEEQKGFVVLTKRWRACENFWLV
ncbi:MAG: hypothetical protein KME57_31105 [Scytonema hyalinum WJT4-NPBG1]|nr:hypothetical protein [Scytonema hyalinum WJT4-NPBG1]